MPRKKCGRLHATFTRVPLLFLLACEGLDQERVARILEEPEKIGEILHARRIAPSEELREGLEEPGTLQHIVNHIKKYNAKPLKIREYRWRDEKGLDIRTYYVENKDKKMFAKFDFDVSDGDRIILEKIALYPDVIE